MKMSRSLKYGFLTVFSMLALVGYAKALDLAEVFTVMAQVESMAVHAKANLVAAATGKDASLTLEEAKTRSDAIDTAVAKARDIAAKIEIDFKNNDNDAAEADGDELAAALKQVADALLGAIPAQLAQQVEEKQSQELSGGRTGNPEDPPNIREVPWKSEGIKAYYQGLFGEFWNASAFGLGHGLEDRDATQE